MTNVLITGGTGFIGSRLALRCVDMGETVRVLAQKNTPGERQNSEELERRGVELFEGSVTDSEATHRSCAGVDVVYHLAAAQHEANVPDSHYYDVNVDGTRNVLQAAVDEGVKRFVHGSTIGVYGIGRSGPVGDHTPLNPDNIYGVTKLEGEKVARSFFDRLPIAIARISETYGPGDRRLVKLFKGIAGKRFFMIGPGSNLHHLVYIDDLIDGLRLAAVSDGAAGKTFVLAGPEAITTDQMVLAVCEALGTGAPKLRVPLWPLMSAAVVMEATLRPLGIQPPLHRRRMNFFVKSFRFSGEDARAAIGYQPKISIKDGAKRTADWYKSMELI
jgi:nucleoside-diphosphate-sugar epimerase